MKYILWLAALPIYYLSALFPKKQGRYVFGAWHGERYGDNSKYLMEHILSNYPEIDAIWMTNSVHLLHELKSRNIHATQINSLKGLYYCATAEFIFTCTGPWDVNRFATCNAKWINLWHGSPIKKIGLDISTNGSFFDKLRRKVSDFVFPFNKERYTSTIAPSEFVEHCFSSAFAGRSNTFIRCGYPRNDGLNNMPHADQYLYLPTHRGEGDGSINKIFHLLDTANLDKALSLQGAKLIIKPHFYDTSKIKDLFSDCLNIKLDNTTDTYELMSQSSVLITDYSSAAVDFAITQRPIVFFAPDLEDYKKRERDLYIEYDTITGGTHIARWEELIKGIQNGFKAHKDCHEAINKLFNQDTEKNYCEKLIQLLKVR